MRGQPLLRVVRGEPSEEELAAVTAVVLAVAAGAPTAEAQEPPRRSAWADKAALMRRTPYPGPGAWRASATPR